MNTQKPSPLGKIFITVFMASLVPSIIVLKLFGFEIGIIFTFCLSVSIVTIGFAGIENTIINKNK